jgi:hypothetical protein
MTPKVRKSRNPELQRRKNMAAFWQQRYDKAGNDHSELASISFDRARAAALRVMDNGQPMVMYELAQMLSEWAEQIERAEAKRQTRGHAS